MDSIEHKCEEDLVKDIDEETIYKILKENAKKKKDINFERLKNNDKDIDIDIDIEFLNQKLEESISKLEPEKLFPNYEDLEKAIQEEIIISNFIKNYSEDDDFWKKHSIKGSEMNIDKLVNEIDYKKRDLFIPMKTEDPFNKFNPSFSLFNHKKI